MAEQAKRQRKPRREKEHAAELAKLKARRDELDAKEVERRAREDAALDRYLVATRRVQSVLSEAEQKAAELEQQAAAVRGKGKDDAAAEEAAQAAALVELHELGRNADELSKLTGIAVKRVRAMVRSARPQRTSVPARPVASPADAEPAPTGKDSPANT